MVVSAVQKLAHFFPEKQNHYSYTLQTVFGGYTVFMSVCPTICYVLASEWEVSNKHCLLTFFVESITVDPRYLELAYLE